MKDLLLLERPDNGRTVMCYIRGMVEGLEGAADVAAQPSHRDPAAGCMASIQQAIAAVRRLDLGVDEPILEYIAG